MDTDEQLKAAQERLADAIAAEDFGNSPSGQLLLKYINDRVSSLVTKIISTSPVTDREYLAVHGGVRELQSINTMLQSKSSQAGPAREEVDAIRGEE